MIERSMTAYFRSRQVAVIEAPLEEVWNFNLDLSRIEQYHPRVGKVDFVSGTSRRGAGVAYQCHLKGSRHTCIERDVEIVPMERIVTEFVSDTFGISKALPDYRVVSSLTRVDGGRTRVEFSHFYSTNTWKAKLVHCLAGRRIAKESQQTLDAMKSAIESWQA
jgi:Polyketide cyclase / dehydrase and lipid transport